MTGLTISSYMPPNILFAINGIDGALLEFRSNGDVYYKHQNSEKLKRVENGEEILEAFKQCVLGYTSQDMSDVLYDMFLSKIDNEELTNKQIIGIEKGIRKIKLKKLL